MRVREEAVFHWSVSVVKSQPLFDEVRIRVKWYTEWPTMSSWLKHHRRKSSQVASKCHNAKLRSASLPRRKVSEEDHVNLKTSNDPNNNNNNTNDCNGTMTLKFFNMRQPTNLTGRFPSTVRMHAKVEELLLEPSRPPNQGLPVMPAAVAAAGVAAAAGSTLQRAASVHSAASAGLLATGTPVATAAAVLPNLVQPLSLLPDWR